MSRLLAASTSVSKLHFGYKKFRLDFHSGLRVASHVGDSVPATLTWTPAFHDKTIFMLESFWLRSQVLVTSTRVILGLYSLPRHRSFGKCTHMSQFSLELHFQVLFRDVMTPFIPELKRSFLFRDPMSLHEFFTRMCDLLAFRGLTYVFKDWVRYSLLFWRSI